MFSRLFLVTELFDILHILAQFYLFLLACKYFFSILIYFTALILSPKFKIVRSSTTRHF